MKNRLSEDVIELYAWVGEDEFGSGQIGLKQGRVPAGIIPLVSIVRGKVETSSIVDQLQAQARKYGKRIQLVRFEMIEVLRELEP